MVQAVAGSSPVAHPSEVAASRLFNLQGEVHGASFAAGETVLVHASYSGFQFGEQPVAERDVSARASRYHGS